MRYTTIDGNTSISWEANHERTSIYIEIQTEDFPAFCAEIPMKDFMKLHEMLIDDLMNDKIEKINGRG